MKRVAVFGMGYVGCVTAACLSRDGNVVVGVDIDEAKVGMINSGKSPITEPGLDDLLAQEVNSGRLSATTDAAKAIAASEVALIAVGTPSQGDGGVNPIAVERVLDRIGEELAGSDHPFVVVVRSTLLPGILEDRLTPILEKHVGDRLGHTIHICNNPEFLRETTAIRDYDQPPFVVVGAGCDSASDVVFDLYSRIEAERITTDTRSAAMVKYACNAFHAAKVTFANEIGALAKTLGADGQKVMDIVCRDTQLNISTAYLRPGFAFGGSCLPKDTRALCRFAQQSALNTDMLAAILTSNSAHIDRALQLIYQTGCRRLGLIGLSFKAGTDDLRESPQVLLAETLLGRGFELRIFDPDVAVTRLVGRNLAYVDQHLPHLANLLVDSSDEVFTNSDCLILATNIANQVPWQTDFHGEVIDLRKDLVVASSACTAETTTT